MKVSLSSKLALALVAKMPVYGMEDTAHLSAGFGVEFKDKKPVVKPGFELNVNI